MLRILLILLSPFGCAQGAELLLKTESFDHDPGWEGYNNRVQPARVSRVIQDFGYCKPVASGQKIGSIGGRVSRASMPAYYAEALAPKTLEDRLTASGTFSLSTSSSGSGVFLGWFNARQPGGTGRPGSSLGLDFDGEAKGARLAVRLISRSNKSCGTFITPFIPGKFRPTPIRNDGTVYRWTLNYDPMANEGKGRFSFRLQSARSPPDDFEGKWFSVDLPAGFKQDGASFDRFGLMNALKAGGALTIHFAALQRDGENLNPNGATWVGVGNRTNYAEANPVGAHDFGFSPGTAHAGGVPGEVGGKLWRGGNFAYYADRVGPLRLDQPLEAVGKILLLTGAPDSDMYLGWFNSAVANVPANSPRGEKTSPNFLGAHIGGPTRVGHYFQPAYGFQNGARHGAKTGPVLTPEQRYNWTLRYKPGAADGEGEIRITLGDESVSLQLRKENRPADILFDRFGLFTSTTGGQMLWVYFDDLRYTAAAK